MGLSQSPLPKSTVVFTPFGAVISGLARTSPFTGVPPTEENDMITGTGNSLGLYMGFLSKRTAPTEMAPAAFGCPTMVDEPLPYSSISN